MKVVSYSEFSESEVREALKSMKDGKTCVIDARLEVIVEVS